MINGRNVFISFAFFKNKFSPNDPIRQKKVKMQWEKRLLDELTTQKKDTDCNSFDVFWLLKGPGIRIYL